MGTSREDIRKWLDEGKKNGATHVIVVCDTFDWENYPVCVMPDDDLVEVKSKYDGKNMQKIMEIYDLSMDIEKQLECARAMNG